MKQKWDEMIRRSFHPSQWYTESRPDDLGNEYPEDRVMYVYRSAGETWQVGFYTPHGDWVSDSEYPLRDDAAQRVHWLNGGN
jgi:hypothetical protein